MSKMFDRDALGHFAGYPVVDLVGTCCVGYVVAQRLETPVVPTIAATFLAREMVSYSIGENTPLNAGLTGGITTFFPAPAQGRHLNNRACNCK